MVKIFETVFGSHLYGLSTPESDADFKGVFLLPLSDVLWSGPEKVAKEDTENTDADYYSLTKFLKMACKNDMVSFDMLHAPRVAWMNTSPYWEVLVENRHRFYSQKMANTLGLARSCIYRHHQFKMVRPKEWSHALRLCYQWGSIALSGDYSFPYGGTQKKLLMEIKLGHVSVDECADIIDRAIKDVELVLDDSGFPEEPDTEFAKDFLHGVYRGSNASWAS